MCAHMIKICNNLDLNDVEKIVIKNLIRKQNQSKQQQSSSKLWLTLRTAEVRYTHSFACTAELVTAHLSCSDRESCNH